MIRNMEILVVEPGKAPRLSVIPNTLEAAEEALGGAVQVGCFLPQRVLLISREDSSGLAPNRCLPGGKGCVSGPFLLCGMPEEGCHFDSLPPVRQAEFKKIFEQPGEFMTVGGTVYADPDDAAEAVYQLWDAMRDGDTILLAKWGGTGQGVSA